MTRAALVAVVAAALVLPAAGAAHEVLHAVERDRAIAVRATFADGEPLAYAAYEVFAPADGSIPHAKGRTDRNGWLAFVPDAPGTWRVKVADATGHGVEARVDVDAAGAAPAASAGPSGLAFVLRPLLGLAAIAAVFAALVALRRRRGRPA